ncbi:MAG TPA: complex I NDUFA9 subunit family protein [bacterium]|nr:complex I NDUFA9 subunit family protein [bacterium]
MRVVVTGAAGFVGRHVVAELVQAGHLVNAMVHSEGLPVDLARAGGVQPYQGDVADPATLAHAFQGAQAVIHLVGIIREFPRRGITFQKLHIDATCNVLQAAHAAGIRRYLHMSALGTRPNAISGYHRTKWEAEELVRASELAWTIFRPSIILGPDSEFLATIKPLAMAPMFPVLGGGQTRVQPVDVRSVAEAFVKSLNTPAAIGQTYTVAGPRVLTYREFYAAIARHFGRPFRPVNIPLALVRPVAAMLQYQRGFPLTLGQLQMLREDNTSDASAVEQDLGLRLRGLEVGLG